MIERNGLRRMILDQTPEKDSQDQKVGNSQEMRTETQNVRTSRKVCHCLVGQSIVKSQVNVLGSIRRVFAEWRIVWCFIGVPRAFLAPEAQFIGRSACCALQEGPRRIPGEARRGRIVVPSQPRSSAEATIRILR
jgi:hypothetical protein